MTSTRRLPLIVMSMMLGILVGPAGCSNSGGDSAAAEPVVDSRFGSAEAIVQYFNELMSQPRPDATAVLEIFYPENELHRQMMEVYRLWMARSPLDHAMLQQFGEPFDAFSITGFEAPFTVPARLTENQGLRALAQFSDWTETPFVLHLVQIENRWWISGYTLEHDPYNSEIEESADLAVVIPFLEMARGMIRRIATDVAQKVERGELATVVQVNREWLTAAERYQRDYPEDAQRMIDYLNAHPNQAQTLLRLIASGSEVQ